MPEIKQALLEMNDKFMTYERVTQLIKLCPTNEEQKALKKYKGSIDNLPIIDRAVIQVFRNINQAYISAPVNTKSEEAP